MSETAIIMRKILFLLSFFISIQGIAQSNKELTEVRNVFNTKGDFHLNRGEYEKAIVFYTMAYRKDNQDFFSVLKKAEAYTRLKLYPQAAECYRIVFDSGRRPDNAYRLKYAKVLYAMEKYDEFRNLIDEYSEVIEEETSSENYLISEEKRLQLYKDTAMLIPAAGKSMDSVKFKVKYAAYQPRRKSTPQDEQISILVSSGEEYHLPSSADNAFKFSFQPGENYMLVIQRENIRAENILNNSSLSREQKESLFLDPPPLQDAEVIIPHGMVYDFILGEQPISSAYLQELANLQKQYQGSGEGAIDLVALARELEFADGEVYTVRFKKDENSADIYRKVEISKLQLKDRTVNIFGQSFFMVFPLDDESMFNVQTEIAGLEKQFNPKKYQLIIDDSPVFQDISTTGDGDYMVKLMVNTRAPEEVLPINRLSGKEITIVPATEYMLSLSKPNPETGEPLEVFVPLTRGVRYNFSSAKPSEAAYKAALAEFLMGRDDVELDNEEVIDISILSKELEVKPGDDLTFTLLPIQQIGKQSAEAKAKSTLTVDGKLLEISAAEKLSINVPFNVDRKVNFQTDLGYVKENFDPSQYIVRLDTTDFTSEITVDTAGLGEMKSTGWLSMNVNTESADEVAIYDQFTASEVSIIPGKEYILTVSKIDAITGKEDEIIIPLLRKVKYDFTAHPESEDTYRESLEAFMEGREDLETTDGTLIDIKLLSKELKIQEGDKVSFSLLPVRKLPKVSTVDDGGKSSLFLDDKVVEFTYIQKYTINMPLSTERSVNMQTNLEYISENYDPASIQIELDTASFFSEITIDTTGLGDRVIEEEITDPVFDVVIVNFDINAHTLRPSDRDKIQESVVDELKTDSRLYVTIKGYTDALGDADYNLRLSQRRAESVKSYLEQQGIGESRIRTFSFGASQALEEGIDWEDLSEEELQKHRKVEIVIYLPE